ncbi:hypothetical protein P4679_27475 [Priestia megaterium]|uniref:GGDEF domain-containing protein n=1 Tax=Priestia megaterium TaxID=1404 RepID=UPI002E22CC6B|nr:hypothetical protein [Priestia megaterium]
MRIYDEGIFLSHLELEIAKSKRFGYPFSLLMIKAINPQSHTIALLNSILAANYRSTDLLAQLDNNIYVILLNGTNEENAQKYLSRLIRKAVSENEIPIMAAITGFDEEDTKNKIMERLMKKMN